MKPSKEKLYRETYDFTKMKNVSRIAFCFLLISAITASAQLVITVSSPKITGQKTVVAMTMKNKLAEKVESARAACFLLDDQGKMVGQSTKWIIGQNKLGLEPGATNTFNFVINGREPFVTTNLTAKISVIRIILAGEKLADPKNDVSVTTAVK